MNHVQIEYFRIEFSNRILKSTADTTIGYQQRRVGFSIFFVNESILISLGHPPIIITSNNRDRITTFLFGKKT